MSYLSLQTYGDILLKDFSESAFLRVELFNIDRLCERVRARVCLKTSW